MNAFEMESVPVVPGAKKLDHLIPSKSAVFVKVFRQLRGLGVPFGLPRQELEEVGLQEASEF